MKYTSLLVAVFALTGCATSDGRRAGTSSPTRITQAATTPLSDLNLVRAEIPPILYAAQKGPYALPSDRSCGALGVEIQALDSALGADLDTPATPANPGLIERGTDAAGQAAASLIRGAAEDLVPFRGWVRKLTGAERYSKEVAAAIAAGTIRRAFLKGLGQAGDCPVPAAPRR
jgi:hypothetical protein